MKFLKTYSSSGFTNSESEELLSPQDGKSSTSLFITQLVENPLHILGRIS
jgi:hypothetical protein